jgi:SNF family Na+-dependent transporter
LHGTQQRVGRSIQMMDLVLLALGLAFFALSIGYAYACERL